mmetsp:Transcript_13575/g.24978  ORF Transcript_13575/g.24978 Transcript_13575/m.24978 type:complete len:85 (-) Transcript_13575:251-505(-)
MSTGGTSVKMKKAATVIWPSSFISEAKQPASDIGSRKGITQKMIVGQLIFTIVVSSEVWKNVASTFSRIIFWRPLLVPEANLST